MSATLPTLRRSLPGAQVSGGRHLWSPGRHEEPADPVEAVRDALHEVLDPELPVSIVDLGLVYAIAYERGTVRIDLTFTATACPCMEFIEEDVRDRLLREGWIDQVEIQQVWNPPWTSERISERGRRRLREVGVSA